MTQTFLRFKQWAAVAAIAFVGVLALFQSAAASDLTMTMETTSTTPGGSSDWTFSFTPESDVSSGTYLYFYTPSAMLDNGDMEYFDLSAATLTSGNGDMTVDDIGNMTIELSETLTAGVAAEFTVANVTNVETEGSYQLTGSYTDYITYEWVNMTANSFVVGTVALDGVVIDPSTTLGVADVYVNVNCYEGAEYTYAYATTDTSGEFTIAGQLSGTCEVSFSYYGELELQAPSAEEIVFTAGETVYRDGVSGDAFEMRVPNVSATLLTPEAAAVSSAWGWVYNDTWSVYEWFETSETGTFSFSLDTSGTYYLEFDITGTEHTGTYTAPDKIEFTFDADLGTTSGLPTNIELVEPSVIVNVYKPDGTTPAPDWTYIYVYDSTYTVWKWGYTVNGQALFNVDAGDYTAEVDWVGMDDGDASAQYIAPEPQAFTAPNSNVALVLESANNTITATTYTSGSSSSGYSGAANTPVQAYYYGWTNDGKNYFYGTTGEDGSMSQNVGAGSYTIYFDSYEYPATYFFTQTYTASFADNTGSTVALGDVVAVAADATLQVSLYNSSACGGGLVSSGAGVSVNSDTVWQWADVSSGVAELSLPAGTYSVSAFAYQTSCEQGAPNDVLVTIGSQETKEVDMTLLDRNAVVSGYVRDSEGAGIGCQWVWGYKTNGGDWFDATTDQDGSYTANVTPGTWYVQSYPSGTSGDNCSSSSEGGDGYEGGDEYDGGDGYEGGDGYDEGDKYDGYETYSVVAEGPTSDGTSSSSTGTGITYVSLEGTQVIEATENTTTSGVNFTFAVADAQLKGYFRYAEGHAQAGEIIPGVNGFVTVATGTGGRTADFYSNAMWGWVENSYFELDVPASPEGGYTLQAYLDYYNNDYTIMDSGTFSDSSPEAPVSATIDVASTETVDVGIWAAENDATITGTITGFTSAAGFYATVCADNGGNGYACTDAWSSTYQLDVAPGNWTVNFYTPEGYDVYPIPSTDNSVVLASGDSATVDFELVAADATIGGTLTAPDDTAIDGATAVLSSTTVSASVNTDTNGAFTKDLPAGTYTVTVNVPDGSSYLNPESQTVIIASGDSLDLSFVAREADATISGTVTDSSSNAIEGALVGAFSSDGAQTSTETDASGAYSLQVIQGEDWTLRATYDDDDGVAHDSGTVALTVDEATETMDFSFSGSAATGISAAGISFNVASATTTLPASQRKSFSSSTQQVFNFSDGAKFVLPAYSTKSSEDTMTGVVTPTSEIPSSSSHQVLSYGYRAEVLDSNNSKVTKFNSAVAITLPYTASQLSDAGVEADDITIAVYDGTSWKDVTGAVVNSDASTVTANVSKFGTFAITTSSRSTASTEAELSTPENLRSVKKLRKAKSFKVKWDAVTGATGYKVQLWKGKKKKKTYSTSKKNKVILKRTANTAYKVRVRAVSGSIQSDWTDFLSLRTKPLIPRKVRVTNKVVNEDETGSFTMRFTQRPRRKQLRAVIKVVDKSNKAIPFKFGKKAYKKKHTFKMKAKKKLQRKRLTIQSADVGKTIRVKVRARSTKKPKANSTAFAKSGLFIVQE